MARLLRSQFRKPVAALLQSPPSDKVLGIDASLTSTGISYRKNGLPSTSTIDGSRLRGMDRLNVVVRSVENTAQTEGITLAVIEDYAMGFGGGNPGRVFDIGELGGAIKLALWRMGVTVMKVPPSSLKCIIADNGHAKKDAMIEALRLNYGYDTPQDDEADALGLMLVGEIRLGISELKSRPHRVKAVDACEITEGQPKLR